MARWIEAQSPAGTLRLVNVDVAAKVEFMFLEGNPVPFLARVYALAGLESDEVIEPAAEQLYAYLTHGDALVPRPANETPAPTTLSDRLFLETGDAGNSRYESGEHA